MPPKRKRVESKAEDVSEETVPKRSRAARKTDKEESEPSKSKDTKNKSADNVKGKKSTNTVENKKITTKNKREAAVKKTEKAEKDTAEKNKRNAVKNKKDSSDSSEDSEEEPEKKKRKTKQPNKVEKAEKPDSKVKNKTSSSFDSIDFSCSKLNPDGKEWNFKISSWNVDGIRAWLKKGGLDFIKYENPDIFCVQETKCSLDKLPEEVNEIEGYNVYWCSAEKDGYSGVGLYSKTVPINVTNGLDEPEHDSEGRMITAEYEKFYVISVYVPNAGRGLVTLPKRLRWNEKFQKYIKELDSKKPVIICGDMNVAHNEIDLSNPKTNKKNAGFTQEERDGMTEFLSDGYVDTFRKLYPETEKAYTFWTYMMNCRAKNIGWRLDYFIVSERLAPSVCDNIIRSEVYGSDHCPITLFLNI